MAAGPPATALRGFAIPADAIARTEADGERGDAGSSIPLTRRSRLRQTPFPLPDGSEKSRSRPGAPRSLAPEPDRSRTLW